MSGKQFWRDASGRLTFELFDVHADTFGPICGAVASAFGLAADGD